MYRKIPLLNESFLSSQNEILNKIKDNKWNKLNITNNIIFDNGISILEYAIKEQKKDIIQEILQKDPKSIIQISHLTFGELIRFENLNIIYYILDLIPDDICITLLNDNNIIYNIILLNNEEEKYKFIKKYENYIEWNKTYMFNGLLTLFEIYIFNTCIIKPYSSEIVNLLYSKYINYPKNKKSSLLGHIFYYIDKNKLNLNLEIIDQLLTLNYNLINETHYGIPNIGLAIVLHNIELLKLIEQKGFNFSDIPKTINKTPYNILSEYLFIIKNKNEYPNIAIIEYLLEKNVNVNAPSYDMHLPGHIVFKYPKYFNLAIKREILKRTEDINIFNSYSESIILYIILYEDIKLYEDILIEKNINLHQKFYNKTTLFDVIQTIKNKTDKKKIIKVIVDSYTNHNKDKKLTYTNALDEMLKNKEKEDKEDNIKLIKYKYAKYSVYSSTTFYVLLYTFALLKNYKQIGIAYNPKIKDLNDIEKIIESKILTFTDEVSKDVFYYNIKPIIGNYKELLYTFIFWGDENNYYISPEIGNAIRHTIKKKKKYIIIPIWITNKEIETSHSNIILIDVSKKEIIHFEPQSGNIIFYVGKMYETLESFFKSELSEFKYISPKTYLPILSFQIISDESDNFNKKLGDPNGFCTAWTFWFVELYINNTKFKLKDLVEKSIKKIFNKTNYTFIEHIRNYSFHLMNKVIKILHKYGLSHKLLYKKNYNYNDYNFILMKISSDIKKLLSTT